MVCNNSSRDQIYVHYLEKFTAQIKIYELLREYKTTLFFNETLIIAHRLMFLSFIINTVVQPSANCNKQCYKLLIPKATVVLQLSRICTYSKSY